MKIKLALGRSKSITLEHLEEELYQVIAEERCHVEAKVGDMVMKTNVGWVVFKDKDCALPRYRIPSQLVKISRMTPDVIPPSTPLRTNPHRSRSKSRQQLFNSFGLGEEE
tara:strand:+ start:539 stop:868 length:330 start_codon:yes stop_codon:yes gene_type:complete